MNVFTPMRAIRLKCVDCCCGNMAEVRRCPVKNCTLHPYRMGHRPKGGADTTAEEQTEETGALPVVEAAEGAEQPAAAIF